MDIYFVMDLSYSMKPHKINLEAAAELIADGIGDLTENFTIGFGSYVEKPTYPFSKEEDKYP